MTSFQHLVPILQLAVGPVILISGVGLLLLTLTNRFGRLLDRARTLHRELLAAQGAPLPAIQAQVDILHRRAGILRLAITLAGITVLLVAILILVLFLAALASSDAGPLIVTLFCGSQVALIGSMLAFLHDMNLSLRAIRLELGR